MTDKNKVGPIIQKLRNEKKWSQKKLAEMFLKQKDSTVISRWERDIVQPSATARKELAIIFKASVKKIFPEN